MDEAKAAQVAATRQAEITKFKNRCLKYHESAALTAILEALAAQHADSPAHLADALRQQIRMRLHVYGIKAAELPCIGGKPGTSVEEEAARLYNAFKGVVKSSLPSRPGTPTPYPARQAAAAPSALAVTLDKDHMQAIYNAWK